MPNFQHVSEARPYQIWPGAIARAMTGKQVQVAVLDIDPNVLVPEHHHVNEQVGFVLQGSITMVIGGEERELRTGDMYTIFSEVPHSALTGDQGATVVDVFNPPRADWEQFPRQEPSKGRWPR